MPNLRIIYDNAIDRAALTADTTSGSLVVGNLKIDRKADVHRATAKSVAYRAVWSSLEALGGVFLVNCNHTDVATMRIRATKEPQVTNSLFFSETFNNAAWVATNVTVGSAVADPSGASSAYTLTAGSATPKTLKQTRLPAAVVIFNNSIWIRRRTGTGAITIWSPDGLVSSVINSLPSTWSRYSVSNLAPASSRSLMIEFSTTGDAIDVFGAQMEPGSSPSSYYPTTAATATRPLGFIDSWQSYSYDSGVLVSCPGGGVNLRNWNNTPIGANAYAYGGGATARHWLTIPDSFYGLAVDVADPTNGSNVEASRLVAGQYWSPKYNAQYELPLTPVDRSVNRYNDAGDLISLRGTRSRKLSVSLAGMPQTDRDTLWDILWGNGCTVPVICSIFPNDTSGKQERMYQIYGKLPTMSPLTTQFINQFSNVLELEEA